MISSIAWVPAGVADPNPKRYEMSSTEQELIRMMQDKGSIDTDAGGGKNSEGKNMLKKAQAPIKHELPADLRMDDYSSDEDEGFAVGNLLSDKSLPIPDEMVPEDEEEEESEEEEDQVEEDEADASKGSHDENDMVSEDGESDDDDEDLLDIPDTREFDPVDVEGLEAMGLSHVSTANGAMYMDDLDGGEDDNSETDDVRLTSNDAVCVVAKTEEDFATLEVHVYDQKKGSLYVHHDIPLPSYPLCLAHGQVSSSGTIGNFCAVGTFSPGIEIWNLDVLNALEPSCILGGDDTTIADDLMRQQMMSEATGQKAPKSRRSNDSGLRPGSHKDAVMALSWNQVHRQVIASGSADCTVKLWDVTQAGYGSNGNCNAGTFSHHKDKVQSVVWHPKEATLLATGSYDRTVALLDARSGANDVKSIKISGDCEALAWDPCHPEYLTVASEDGTISCWDVRKFETSKPLWSFVANEYGGVSDFSYNEYVPGLLATCSTDKSVTLWDTCSQGGSPVANVPPRACATKDMCCGKLFSVAFYPSSPWLVGSGGSGNMLALWDLSGEDAIRTRFQTRVDEHKLKSRAAEVNKEGSIEEANEEGSTEDVHSESKQQDLEAMLAPKDEASTVEKTSNGKKKSKSKSKGLRKK